MVNVLSALVAVLGTLSGVCVTSWFQARSARAQYERARRDATRRDAMDAVVHLVEAIDAHRAAMWKSREAGLSGRDGGVDVHVTRKAISAPLTRVVLLLPALAPVARAAARAAYDMRSAVDLDALQGARMAALAAVEELVAVAAKSFGGSS